MAKVVSTDNDEALLATAADIGASEAEAGQITPGQAAPAAPTPPRNKCREIVSLLGNSKVVKVTAVVSLTQAAGLINLGLVQAPLAAATFADNMAVMSQRFMIASAFAGVMASPYFGRFTDRRGRRSAMVFGILAAYWLPLGGLAAIGWSKEGLWFSLFAGIPSWFMNIIPVQWAMVSDALSSEQKQMGFAVVMTLQCLVSFLFMLFGFALTRFYADTPLVIVWYVLLLASVAACIAACIPPKAASGAQRSDGPLNPLKTLWAPVRFIRRSATLQALGAVTGLLTLSCKMLYSFTLPFCYQNLGLLGEGHAQQQQLVSSLWMYLPMLALTPVNLLMGVWSDRFGPSVVASIFIPVAALGMMLLSLMVLVPEIWFVPIGGFLSALSHPVFVVINPLISRVVPAKHVGEAFGAVASCKALANLGGPILMSFVLQSLEDLGRNDLYWVLIIACGAVMLLAVPFTVRLHRLVREAANASETGLQWAASWASDRESVISPMGSIGILADERQSNMQHNVREATGAGGTGLWAKGDAAGKDDDELSTALPTMDTLPAMPSLDYSGFSEGANETRGVSAASSETRN